MGGSGAEGPDFTAVRAVLGLAGSSPGQVSCTTLPLVVHRVRRPPPWIPTRVKLQTTTYTPQINSGLISEAEAILDSVIATSPRELGARVARGTARALRRNLTGRGRGGQRAYYETCVRDMY